MRRSAEFDMKIMPRLKVKTTRRKGRGVFANCRIRRGEIIEVAPVIVVSRKEEAKFAKLTLLNYCYNWGARNNQTAFAMGFGSFYNHSNNPNAIHYNLPREKVIVFRALIDIAKGEEITHNYNGNPQSQRPIKFSKNGWERV